MTLLLGRGMTQAILNSLELEGKHIKLCPSKGRCLRTACQSPEGLRVVSWKRQACRPAWDSCQTVEQNIPSMGLVYLPYKSNECRYIYHHTWMVWELGCLLGWSPDQKATIVRVERWIFSASLATWEGGFTPRYCWWFRNPATNHLGWC